MKTKSFALAALIVAAAFVAGESVVVLDRVERTARAHWGASRVQAAVMDASQRAEHLMRVLLCVAKS